MILLLLATIWLVNNAFGIEDGNNIEVVDVVKQDDWKSDVEGHIESVEFADDVIKSQGDQKIEKLTECVDRDDDDVKGNWKSEVEGLIVQFHTQPRQELAKIICTYMYTFYPDITWAVLVYDDITGGDAHQMRYYLDNTHIVFRYHGHNVVVTRYAGDTVTTGNDLEQDLMASFTPTCRRYCHDPACWNRYWHVDCEITNKDTFDKLVKLAYVELFHVIQSRFDIYNFVGRTYSDTGKVDFGSISGSSCEWDRRVVQKTIKTTCDNQSAVMMLLGTSN